MLTTANLDSHPTPSYTPALFQLRTLTPKQLICDKASETCESIKTQVINQYKSCQYKQITSHCKILYRKFFRFSSHLPTITHTHTTTEVCGGLANVSTSIMDPLITAVTLDHISVVLIWHSTVAIDRIGEEFRFCAGNGL